MVLREGVLIDSVYFIQNSKEERMWQKSLEFKNIANLMVHESKSDCRYP
jgi:hypothetical protein